MDNKQFTKNEITNNSCCLRLNFIKDLAEDSYCNFWNDNTFTCFKSYNNIFFVIYANALKSIICLDLINNQIISEIKYAHNNYITNFRHYLDKENKRDLIISLSKSDNNLKLWNINNFECLLNIRKIYELSFLSSALLLKDNNKMIIITSSYYFDKNDNQFIKLFDLNGNLLKTLNDSNYNTSFIDSYYDNKLSKTFIITGNDGYSKSYDYNEDKTYFEYHDNHKNKDYHKSIIIDENETIIKLIESCCDGFIRIWNFHSANLLDKINVNNGWLYSI